MPTARAWFSLAGIAVLLPLPVFAVIRSNSSGDVHVNLASPFDGLSELMLAAAALALARAVRDLHRPLARIIAIAAIVHAAVELIYLTPGVPNAGIGWLNGKLLWVASPLTFGGLAFMLLAFDSDEHVPRRAVIGAAVFAGSSFLLKLVFGALPPLPVDRSVAERALVIIGLAVVARQRLPVTDTPRVPEPWQRAVSAMSAVSLWKRVRVMALGLFVASCVSGWLGHTSLTPGAGAVSLGLIAVASGPFLTRAVFRLRQAPPEGRLKGLATLALVVLLLRGPVNALMLAFMLSYVGRYSSISPADIGTLEVMTAASAVLAIIADSALLAVAGRARSALGWAPWPRRPQLGHWGMSAAWFVIAFGSIAMTHDASRSATDTLAVVCLAVSAAALWIPARVSGALVQPAEVPVSLTSAQAQSVSTS
jgi:hypothetical protein